jgi:hypothetical protein
MCLTQTFDVLANRIRLGIEKSGFLALFKEDLERLWEQNEELSPAEKKHLIENIAASHGFQVRVAGNLTLAVFTSQDRVL